MPNLKVYDAYGYRATETLTDECFMGLDHLVKFVMYGNRDVAPDFIHFKFPENMSELNMGWVKAREYGECLVNAVHLKTLMLRNNALQRFPLLGFITTNVKLTLGPHNGIDCIGLGDLQRIKYARLIQLENNDLAANCSERFHLLPVNQFGWFQVEFEYHQNV